MLPFADELTLGAAVIAGLGAGLSPCTLPTAALVVGFVGGARETTRLQSFFWSLSFVLGLSLTLAVFGVLASSLGSLLLNMTYLYVALGILMILLGLVVVGAIPLNIGLNQGALRFFTTNRGGMAGAFILGIPFAVIASPCTVPITAAVLAFAVTKADLVFGFWLLLLYAIGRSVPLLIIGTFTGLLKSLLKKQAILDGLQKFSGFVLIGLGIYFAIFTR